jgi:predicted Zn-dependent protease
MTTRPALLLLALAACQRPHYLGAAVPHPCTARDVEGCLGWMAERDLAAAELDIYEDSALRSYVQGVVDRLAVASPLVAGQPPRVVIADRDDTYATSGRRIVIGRTTIERLASEAELAGVLAHELAHVEAHHGVASLFGRPPEDSLAARRDAEAIADERAIWLLERAGYAPRAFARALRAILDAEDDEHPLRADRIARVEALAAGRRGIEGSADLLDHLDHMVVGRDPRRGARIGDSWVVAALGLALPVDNATDTIRSTDDVLALRRSGSTIVAYAIGVPWARELASSLEDRTVATTDLGPLATGVVPAPVEAGARAPLDKLAHAVRSTLPQPAPGTRVAILVRPRGALVLELGGREDLDPALLLRQARPSELAAAAPTRIAIARAPRAGTLAELAPCPGRLLDDPCT